MQVEKEEEGREKERSVGRRVGEEEEEELRAGWLAGLPSDEPHPRSSGLSP